MSSIPQPAILSKILQAPGVTKTFLQGPRQRQGIARGNEPTRSPLFHILLQGAGTGGDDRLAKKVRRRDEGGLRRAGIGQDNEAALLEQGQGLRVLKAAMAQLHILRQLPGPKAGEVTLAGQDQPSRQPLRLGPSPGFEQDCHALVGLQTTEEKGGERRGKGRSGRKGEGRGRGQFRFVTPNFKPGTHLVAEEEVQERQIADGIPGKPFPVALPVDEDVARAAQDGGIPQVQQRAVGRAGMGVEVVQRVQRGDAEAAEMGEQEGIPEVRAGEVDEVKTCERVHVRTCERGHAQPLQSAEEAKHPFDGEAGVVCGDGGVNLHAGGVAVGGVGGRGDEVHLMPGGDHPIGVIGGVLMHPEGGGEQDVTEAQGRRGARGQGSERGIHHIQTSHLTAQIQNLKSKIKGLAVRAGGGDRCGRGTRAGAQPPRRPSSARREGHRPDKAAA